MNIPDGFTKWDFNLRGDDYKGFAWFGELLIELDGETEIVRASGTPMGDHGDFRFKFDNGEFTQEEVNRFKIIAFKTERDGG